MNNSPPIYQHPELDGQAFTLQGAKHPDTSLLFIHGFTATTVEVKIIANFFHMKGFTVSAPLLPGHGQSPKELNRKNWKNWVKAVEDSYKTQKNSHKNVYVFGESMGALLTLWLAANHSEIKKIFLFSPALVIDGLWSAKLFWPLRSYIFKKNIDDSMAWQGLNVVPLRAAASLYDFQWIIKKLLPTIETEAFIFQGKLDSTINPKSAELVYEQLKSNRKTLTWLDESRHCILLDKQIDLVQEQCYLELLNNLG